MVFQVWGDLLSSTEFHKCVHRYHLKCGNLSCVLITMLLPRSVSELNIC